MGHRTVTKAGHADETRNAEPRALFSPDIKTVFILAPHTDDGELGCGGTIARMIECGLDVHYVAFSTARQSLSDQDQGDVLRVEVQNATKKLGIPESNVHIFDYEVRKLNYVRQDILEDLVRFRKSHSIDLVFMPVVHDVHQDHATVAAEALRAFKTGRLLGYELIWNNLEFTSNLFVPLERRHLDSKLTALAEYRSQSHRRYMNKEFQLSMACVRGCQVGVDYAECFEVIRWIA